MINVYYVGSYDDDEFGSARHFVGWSKNIMAIRMYNVAGHCTGAFYDHYNMNTTSQTILSSLSV